MFIRYLHAAGGFTVKETWIKSTRADNFVSWTGLTVRALRRNFPESDETRQGHMKQMSQGVLRMLVKNIVWVKKINIDTDADESPKKQRDVFGKTYFAKDTFYANQTGKFPV